EMRELGRSELGPLRERLQALEADLTRLLVPRDARDERSVLLEIRAGTGGDEASLFAADLFRMYSRYAERRGWKVDIMSSNATGIVVHCRDEKSQHKNKAKAMKILRARLLEQAEEAQRSEIAAARKGMVGSGDRSERIRTYNFPQGRVSDHRINLTIYTLDRFLDGELDAMIDALVTSSQAEALKAEGVGA